MRRLFVLALIMLVPLLLSGKDPYIDDWPSDGDGEGGCKTCETTTHDMGNGVIVVTINCADATVPGNNYNNECRMEENLCILYGGTCSYNP